MAINQASAPDLKTELLDVIGRVKANNPELGVRMGTVFYRDEGDRRQEATSLRRLGMLHFEQGHLIQAENLLNEALVLHRALGDRQLARAAAAVQPGTTSGSALASA